MAANDPSVMATAVGMFPGDAALQTWTLDGYRILCPDAVDKASPRISGCGEVSFPESGVTAKVVVAEGDLSCSDAMAVFQKYLTDHSLEHTGNSWSAQFDGWGCSTPTATAAESYGYIGQCTKEGTEIRALRN